MHGIPLVDVPNLSARYVRSALPTAPVIEGEKRRRVIGSRRRRGALGSRHG
jgi:hypothetical protein